MAILWRNRVRDPESGYATTFLRQMEEILPTCIERSIRVVSNAGGLAPAVLAKQAVGVDRTSRGRMPGRSCRR